MTRRNEVMVGLAVILGLMVIVFGTMWLQGIRLGHEEIVVQARFREVGQLLTGGTVKFRGVPIGRVRSIDLEPAGAAVIVTMNISGDVRLPEDPVVILSPESMFGDWQAEIAQRAAFPTYNFLEAPDPAVLPGYALPDMSRLTAVADEIAQNMARLSARFELAFTDETALNIREAIENIQDASQQLASLISQQQVAIEEVAQNLERTSEAAGQAAVMMQRAFAEIETAIGGGRLTSIVQNVERTTMRTDSLTLFLLGASRELRSTAAVADTTFRQLSGLAAAVERGEGTLGMLLSDTTLYLHLIDTNLEVQTLLRDIRRNPRRYINLTIF
jgi:phospholipid/cholesterol/gamma-HCH transport system substrate-binding protein